jgi:lysophospholipid acyltransferase (LPLAT)-like uncharacterized protein
VGSVRRASHLLMAALGVLVGCVARLWLATLRLNVVLHPALAASDEDTPWVMGFWHGRQWPLFAWKRRRKIAVLVSQSKDGSLQARALAVLGLAVVRGSSSRGGARGLAGIVRKLRRGMDAGFAVDGPKGPLGVVKGGVVTAARAAGAWLVPVGSAIERGLVLRRAWDRYAIAWPFTRVHVVLGGPIDPQGPHARDELEAAIRRANTHAQENAGELSTGAAARRRSRPPRPARLVGAPRPGPWSGQAAERERSAWRTPR